MTRICAVIMTRNETKRIATTINSVQSLDGIVLYDTGSDDDTIEVAKNSSRVPIHIGHGDFTDFATSRNESLKFAKLCAKTYGYEYFLLMDANDELIGGKPIIENSNDQTVAWYVEQRLKYGVDAVVSFHNVKFIKADADVSYVGRVHEYLDRCGPLEELRGIYLFQDKTADDNKSQDRWLRDVIILEQDHEKDPTDTRVLFYLAQTYACLGDDLLALDHYEKRTKSIGGFEEERCYSFMKCGDLADKLGKEDDAIHWYTKACRHTLRCEPIISLAKIFRRSSQFLLAYTYAKLACELEISSKTLFVERECSDYDRWHILGIVAWYAAKCVNSDEIKMEMLRVGRKACRRAIETGKNVDLDTKNLSFYD
jgi:glycosyltransferase involved in cell wall biosynthesis